MSSHILSSRQLNFPVEHVYRAFENPELLKLWWGPEGFSNTIHEFDLRVGGNWKLTMHGPEKGNYENASVFKEVIPHQKVSWKRISQPLFDMDILFERVGDNSSKITFVMKFSTEEECEKIRPFAAPKNEENFDRLERLLNSH